MSEVSSEADERAVTGLAISGARLASGGADEVLGAGGRYGGLK